MKKLFVFVFLLSFILSIYGCINAETFVNIVSDKSHGFIEIQPIKEKESPITPIIYIDTEKGEFDFFISVSLNSGGTWLFMNKVKFKYEEIEFELTTDDSKVLRIFLDTGTVFEEMSFNLDNEQIEVIKTLMLNKTYISYRIYSNTDRKYIDFTMTDLEKEMFLNMIEYYNALNFTN